MPFNKDNPPSDAKIRRLSELITPNWQAIEQGSQQDADGDKLKLWSVNFFSRDDIPADPGNNAASVTDGFVLFSKTDSDTSQPELFTRHEDASVRQLTKGPPNIAPSGFANNGETSIYGGLLVKYGRFASGNTTGSFTVTFAGTGTTNACGLTAFPNNCFVVIVKAYGVGTLARSVDVQSVSAASFDMLKSTSHASYQFIAIGN